MDKTPVQMAIDSIQEHLDTQPIRCENERTAMRAAVKYLQSLLPTERQFAETYFDAGWNYRENHDYDFNNEYPDFNNLYKQYTHE